MRRLNFDRVALGLFFLASVIVAFLYGTVAARYRLFPFDVVEPAYAVIERTLEVPHYLCPIRYSTTGVKIHDRDAMAPGVTLVTSYWPEGNWSPSIRLIDADGNVLHYWTVPNPENRAVHGTYLFDNGDVMFNIGYVGLYRISAAGELLWRLPRTHHSITRDDDGNFWVCAYHRHDDDEEGRKWVAGFPGLQLPLFEDRLIKVSPDGEILKDLSVVEILFNSGNRRFLWKISKSLTHDLCHLNDVEALSREMADQYPLFEAGDLVFSLRSPHFVAVVDPDTEQVKWTATGPFLEQHDPDFIGDGWIGIFDNHSDNTEQGLLLGGSRIVAIKPETNEVRVVYPRTDSQGFYTQSGGKWQQFDNGNLLITEARAGRLFEVNAQGELVWEWFHEHYNDKYVPEVLEGTRYNYSPEQVSAWYALSDAHALPDGPAAQR